MAYTICDACFAHAQRLAAARDRWNAYQRQRTGELRARRREWEEAMIREACERWTPTPEQLAADAREAVAIANVERLSTPAVRGVVLRTCAGAECSGKHRGRCRAKRSPRRRADTFATNGTDAPL